MSKPKTDPLSRRDFLSVSVGAAVIAGIGCTSDDQSAKSGDQTTGSGGSGTSNATGGATGSNQATNGGANHEGGSSVNNATSSGGNASGGSSNSLASSTTSGGSASGGNSSANGGASSPASSGTPNAGGTQTASNTSKPIGAGAGGRSSASTTKANGGTSVTGGTNAGSGKAGNPTSSGGTVNAAGATSGTGDQPLVCLARNSNVIQAVKDAIDAVGGLPDLTGKTVLLRPNAIVQNGPPYTTGPDVVRAVIQAIKAKGKPKAILVGEDAFQGDVISFMKGNGVYAAATDEGATPTDMGQTPTKNVKPSEATNWTNGIDCYEAFLNADYIINMPVCKSHAYANFTMAIKAWYGNQNTFRNSHPTNLEAALPEIHLARKADFVVLDATKTLLNNGPFAGDGDVTAAPGIIVATPDTLAADITGLCIMKHYLQQANKTDGAIAKQSVWKQGQIQRAMKLTSLGWTSDKKFPYKAIGIDEVTTIMAYRDA